MNPMREIKIEKVTLNIGAGRSPEVLEKGLKLLRNIAGMKPVKTVTNKRIPAWDIRPGLAIGCKVTIRKNKAKQLVTNLLKAKDNKLNEKQFDDQGNVAFGIHEYIDIPGVSYDPEIGIMGLEVCVTFERPGFRVKRRRIKRKRIGSRQKVSKQDAIDFMKKEFGVLVGGGE